MQKERLSYSFASKLLSNPFELVHYQLDHPKPPSDTMLRGNCWEYCLRNGTGEVDVYATTKTRGVKFDAYLTKKQEDNSFYIDHPYLVVTEAEKNNLDSMLANLNPELDAFFKSPNTVYQRHFEMDGYTDSEGQGQDFGVPVHGYTDFEDVNTIFDLKISDPEPTTFAKQVVNMGWDIQAFLYSQLGKDFKWIVISPTAPHTQRILTPSDASFVEAGERKFWQAIELFKEFNRCDGVFNIHAHIDAPRWI